MARRLKAPVACSLSACPPITHEAVTTIVSEARDVLIDMGAPVLPWQVSQRTSFSHALITGQAVTEFEPDGRAACEIDVMRTAVTRLARTFPRPGRQRPAAMSKPPPRGSLSSLSDRPAPKSTAAPRPAPADAPDAPPATPLLPRETARAARRCHCHRRRATTVAA